MSPLKVEIFLSFVDNRVAAFLKGEQQKEVEDA